MKCPRYVHVVYCDDVRQEVGGKITLVGCYGADLIVESPQGEPTLLPKLFAVVTAVTDIEDPFERVRFRAFLGDDVLADMESAPIPPRDPSKSNPNAKRISVSAVMAFVPFAAGDQPTKLRIEVETERETLSGPALRILFRHTTSAGTNPPSDSDKRP